MLGPCPECGKVMKKIDNETGYCKKCNIEVPIFDTSEGWCDCKSSSKEGAHYVVWEGEGLNHGWICNSCGCLTQVG